MKGGVKERFSPIDSFLIRREFFDGQPGFPGNRIDGIEAVGKIVKFNLRKKRPVILPETDKILRRIGRCRKGKKGGGKERCDKEMQSESHRPGRYQIIE